MISIPTPGLRVAALAAALLLGACASQPPQLPPLLITPGMKRIGADTTLPQDVGATPPAERMPAPPGAAPVKRVPEPEPTRPPPRQASATISFDQVPLATMIQVVYADILGRTVQVDPAVAQRRDLVTFRTPPDEPAERIEAAARMVLGSYGLAIIDAGGMVRVLPDNAQTGVLPDLRRGSALPETPAAMRTVFQLVPLASVRANEVVSWLKTLLGNRVTVQEDAARNSLMISGTGANVGTALNLLKELDQPLMSGRASLRITPVYWSAAELAQTLTQVLTAEGYSMPALAQSNQPGGVRYPIVLLPVTSSNALLVFANDDRVLDHVQTWALKLDQPTQRASGRNIFTYTARNLSADALASTLTQLLDGTSSAAATSAAPAGTVTAAATTAPTAARSGSTGGGRVVVDANSNTLIFNTSPENYSQIIGLLNVLDRPAKSALIEVTVAEVSLTDDLNLGVEWLLQHSGASGSTITGSTLGGLGLGTSGLTIKRLDSSGDTRLVINALASTNRAQILSSPRVMARNGEQAKIQVGQQVPIITSQQSSLSNTSNSSTGILQTVQYKDTGVLLTVKPSIYAGDRIDLEVAQEVSAAQTTQTGVSSSPTFATRKVETRLTLEHGATVMLGGLISEDKTRTDTGVPFLKDIPLLGNAFKNDKNNGVRRELIVLITPYIVNDGQDAAQITDAFRAALPMLGGRPTTPPALPAPVVPPPKGEEPPLPPAAPPASAPASGAPEAAAPAPAPAPQASRP
ncbi:type II secretion system secretin GspD [Rubrivivax sp. JA1024]|nr:type II secretion system secretin GspD [Rubrivivax sp. JA1024]